MLLSAAAMRSAMQKITELNVLVNPDSLEIQMMTRLDVNQLNVKLMNSVQKKKSVKNTNVEVLVSLTILVELMLFVRLNDTCRHVLANLAILVIPHLNANLSTSVPIYPVHLEQFVKTLEDRSSVTVKKEGWEILIIAVANNLSNACTMKIVQIQLTALMSTMFQSVMVRVLYFRNLLLP